MEPKGQDGETNGADVLILRPGETPCSTSHTRCRRRDRPRYAPVGQRLGPGQAGGGFTLVELLVVIGIIALLIAILLPVLGNARASSQSVSCLANLRQIMMAFNLFANDNGQKLPPPSNPINPDPNQNQSWESHLRKYLPAREVFRCPADNVVFDNYFSSYDWRDTPDPHTTVAGRMLAEIQRSDAVFVFDALPEWHSKMRINTGMIDGSAKSMDYREWARDMERPVGAGADVPRVVPK